MNKNLFEIVMDKDEEIIKTYKPNKARAWIGCVILTLLYSLLFVPLAIADFTVEKGEYVVAIGVIVVILISLLIAILFQALWLNKTVYAVTNKRILIRTGFIGVDYKSLDYSMLGALTVNVSWIDKLIRKHTGSISFGSMASPITNSVQAKFNFTYVSNPYETYKEIKAIIDEHKQK